MQADAVHELPLFPLHAVIFPCGRLPLQVFEPRYVQLVKRCVRDQVPFGVVQIHQGDEVRRHEGDGMPEIARLGTRVQLVDWFSLQGGMLGATIEGQDCFGVQQHWQVDDGLVMAKVSGVSLPVVTLPDADRAMMLSLWQDLRRHPQLEALGYSLEPASDKDLLGRLLQVLPMDGRLRYQLLQSFGQAACIDVLRQWLHEQGIA